MSRRKFLFENEDLHANLRKQEKRIMNWPLFTSKTFEGKGKLRRSEKIEAEVMKGRQKEALVPVKKGRQQKRK